MKLFVDTSDRQKTIVKVGDKKYVSFQENGASQELLKLIKKALSKNNIKVSDITEIEVGIGPGSFTGLRVGVAVCETLAWVLGVPVNGKNVAKGGGVEIIYEK